MAQLTTSFIPRNEMDIAVVGAGSWVKLADDGTIAEARIGLGAKATPLVAEAAAASLIGKDQQKKTLQPLENWRNKLLHRSATCEEPMSIVCTS